MIGSRCLRPSGSAIRSSAASALFIALIQSLPAPVAECCYRTWQPPQPSTSLLWTQTAPEALSCIRYFSSTSQSRREQPDAPHAVVAVGQHGIESFMHESPFDSAKAKRVIPATESRSDSAPAGTDAHASNEHNTASRYALDNSASASHDHVRSTVHPSYSTGSVFRPSSGSQLVRSRVDIPAHLLLNFLTASDQDTYRNVKNQLPSNFYRIDAYLLLRQIDPQSLSALSYLDIYSLIARAGQNDLGGVLRLLLQDILGADMFSTKAKPGYFQIFAGTEERYKLLREILIRCNHSEFLLHDGTALNVFMLMLDDLCQLRPSANRDLEADMDAKVASDVAPSTAGPTAIDLPHDFPVGETRRLVKLLVNLHHPELAPVLNAMQNHLEARTPDFPTAREGAQLIAYYLQPDLRDFGAALDVVRALRDTNALAQEVIDDAIRDGKKFLAELESAFPCDDEGVQAGPSTDQLQQICMDVSLRLIALKSVMAHRPKGGVQFRKALESLVSSFRLDLLDSYERQRSDCDMRSLLDVPFRNIRSVILHMIGQSDKSCLMEAFFVLQRCDQRLVAMLPDRDLQEFCDAAARNECLRLASETYAHFVKVKTSSALLSGMPIDCRHNLVRDGLMTDTDTFLALMHVLSARRKKITIFALLRALRLLPLTDLSTAQLNIRFTPPQRAQFIALLAKVGLTGEAFTLFQHWSQWQYDADSDFAGSTNTASSLRRPGSVQVADPLIERQIRLMHNADRQVATSATCLIALVRSFCQQFSSTESGTSSASTVMHGTLPSDSASKVSSERFQKARFVIEVFRRACMPIDWTHYRLTALARACFIAKDVPGAFDALAKISFLRQIPDQLDIAVLLGGLVEHDADKAVNLFIQHCTVPETIGAEKEVRNGKTDAGRVPLPKTIEGGANRKALPKLAPMKPTPVLAGILISRAIAQDRMDLVDRLYDFSESVGISSELGHIASLRAMFSPNLTPGKVIKGILRILQNGWPADPALIEVLAQRLLYRSMERLPAVDSKLALDANEEGLPAPRGKSPPPKERLQLVQAATHLMEISAGATDVVNLRSVRSALDAICGAKNVHFAASSSAGAGEGASSDASRSSLRAARRMGQEERRLQWIASLDSIVHLLRWTRFFDTGDDYRHNLPLWKPGNALDGELISADLEEMVDFGFGRSRPWQTQIKTGEGAATPSSLAKASAQARDGARDDADGFVTASTGGVFKHETRHSPNVLPPDLYRQLIETYLVLGDWSGAAEVASWMRDEAKLDLARTPHEASEFVDRIKEIVLNGQTGSTSVDLKQDEPSKPSEPSEPSSSKSATERPSSGKEAQGNTILRMLAGQSSTAHTKSWWTL